MAYFPIYVDLKDKKCVVVGGGKIALRKIEILYQFGAKITIVAPYICDDIYKIEESSRLNQKITSVVENSRLEDNIHLEDRISLEEKDIHINLVERKFIDMDISEAELVVAATDDENLNSHISAICREKNLLVNVVDVKEECSFIFPAIYKKGELVISISTGGSSPLMAAKIRENIDSVVPDYYSSLIEFLGDHRDYIKREIHSQELRKKVYNEFIEIVEIDPGHMSLAMINKVIDKYKIRQEGDY